MNFNNPIIGYLLIFLLIASALVYHYLEEKFMEVLIRNHNTEYLKTIELDPEWGNFKRPWRYICKRKYTEFYDPELTRAGDIARRYFYFNSIFGLMVVVAFWLV